MTVSSRELPAGSNGMTYRVPVAVPRIANLLVAGSLIAASIFVLLVGQSLWQGRQDAQRLAERSSENLLHSITGYVEHDIQLYSFILDIFAERLNNPEIAALSSSAQAHVLTAIAAREESIANVLVLGPTGDVAVASHPDEPISANFADRDYFRVARDDPNAVYISDSFQSPLREGDPSIAISRSFSTPDGRFAGVIAIMARLAVTQEFFSTLDPGPHGALTLLSPHGELLARQPPLPEGGEPDRPLSFRQDRSLHRLFEEESGSFVATSTLDGVERDYTFARVPRSSLIISVGLATEDIFAAWRWRTLTSTAVTVLACGIIVSLALILRRELHRRAQAEAVLARQSLTDGLTGLDNRRQFDAVMQYEWLRAIRDRKPLSLLMIDVDRFKLVNDRYGHATGDEVLKELARVIEASIRRPGDLGARYGGEEFAAILPDTDGPGAGRVAEAIRKGCEAYDGDLPQFTVSVGVNTVRPTAGMTIQVFQDEADKALYRAKQEGRNRVMLAA